MFKDFYSTKSSSYTCLIHRTKGIRIICFYIYIDFSYMHFPTTHFLMKCGLHILAWHSEQRFAVVNRIREYSCVMIDKECLHKTELL